MLDMGTVEVDNINPFNETSNAKESPVRAPKLFKVIHRTSPLKLLSGLSPERQNNRLIMDLSPPMSSKGQSWRKEEGTKGVLMRRTASLDAIYLKGHLLKDAPAFVQLNLDKSTQTPAEWSSLCLSEVPVGCGPISDSVNGKCNNRRSASSLPSSPWPPLTPQSSQPSSPVAGETIDKFIRQRLQRTNKEASAAVQQRYSPVPGDHSLIVSSQASLRSNSQANGSGGKSTPFPQLPKPLLPRLRGSVEGLNQEIEKLVLRPSAQNTEDADDGWSERGRDGRQAPIAMYLRSTRSVNTQTPARGSRAASATSSSHSSPSESPCFSPPVLRIPTPDFSRQSGTTATSPRLNKFYAREPPDGCEKVSLKHSEVSRFPWETVSLPEARPQVFTLKPSQGSAFCPLDRSRSSSSGLLGLCNMNETANCVDSCGRLGLEVADVSLLQLLERTVEQ